MKMRTPGVLIAMIFCAVGALAQTNTFPSSGNVGIGTTSPSQALEVIGNEQIDGSSSARSYKVASSFTDLVNNAPWYGIGDVGFLLPGSGSATGDSVQVAGFGGLNFETGSGRMVLTFAGNVGIGMTSPAQKLEVNGNAQVDGSLMLNGSGDKIVFGDGTTQTSAWNGTVCGGDYAESVDPAGTRDQYEPGDVLVLTADGKGDVEKSSTPYSTMVAGVYSTKPGVVGRRVGLAKSPNEIPMAMVGIVPTKVSAENGPIHRGDLLVTSSTPGYAMKGTDRGRMLGAVIGKAMGNLNSGTGVIEVLVSLQ